MNTTAVTVVVGDKFSEFAALESTTTVSRLANLFDGLYADQQIPEVVLFGQGVSEGWRSYLTKRALATGRATEFIGGRQIDDRTGRKFCHKWNRHNVLITHPQQVSPKRYDMLLSIDDACEIMSDHVSGYHVQGMIFIEAARQAFLAVSECFLLPKDSKYYFVINKLDTTYHRFAFPLPTDITLEIMEYDSSRSDRYSAKVLIRFFQCGECVAESRAEYTAILEEKLLGKEKSMALAALGSTLQQASATAMVTQ